jgi:hypothetical protein
MYGASLVSVKRRIPAACSFKIVQDKNVSLRKKKFKLVFFVSACPKICHRIHEFYIQSAAKKNGGREDK